MYIYNIYTLEEGPLPGLTLSLAYLHRHNHVHARAGTGTRTRTCARTDAHAVVFEPRVLFQNLGSKEVPLSSSWDC